MVQDPERDRLSGRLSRFAKVGAGLSGAAVSYGANRILGGEDADARNATHVNLDCVDGSRVMVSQFCIP